MKKFIIAIEETFVGQFEIEAKDTDEAMKIAEKKYESEKLVSGSGEVQFKQMAVIQPFAVATEWIEF